MVPQKMQSMAKRLTLSASDDHAVMEQVVATHSTPVEGHIDVRPLLNVVQDIFHRITTSIPPVGQVYKMYCHFIFSFF